MAQCPKTDASHSSSLDSLSEDLANDRNTSQQTTRGLAQTNATMTVPDPLRDQFPPSNSDFAYPVKSEVLSPSRSAVHMRTTTGIISAEVSDQNVISPPRSSSLRRHTSTSSKETSTLAGSTASSTKTPVNGTESRANVFLARLSSVTQAFVDQVKQLNETRKMFCTDEYPLSFNGEEAVNIMRDIFPEGRPDGFYRKMARALMHTSPPLIAPILYSEKSLKKNTLYDSPDEIYTLVEETLREGLPQGVYSALATCYNPFCEPGEGGCYAPCCPNKIFIALPLNGKAVEKRPGDLERHFSMTSSIASSHDTTLSRAWSANVPREILQNTSPEEVKRQEAIHELIYTEEDYVRDLNLLDELFAKPLATAQCIESERRQAFCDNVFNNYLELLAIHKDLYRTLRDHQGSCQAKGSGGFVDRVGDIFLRFIHRFMAAYSKYGPHVVLAEYAVKKETTDNILFQNFVREKEKQAETRKLPFRHFLILPVTRLQRYPLLLNAVLKKTPDEHPDKKDLTTCLEIVRDVASKMDEASESTKMTLRLYQINDSLRFKDGKTVDLQLTQPGRRLLHEGILKRRPHMRVETVDYHVFVFDHAVLITKVKSVANNTDDEYYASSMAPIPMGLLTVHDSTEGLFGLRSMSSNYTMTHATESTLNIGLTASSSQGTSIVLRHLGRNGDDYLFWAENSTQRMEWKEKLLKAKEEYEKAIKNQKAFDTSPLGSGTFALPSSQEGGANRGKVTCSIPFVGANGSRMVAIGTQSGIWMGPEDGSFRLVLVMPMSEVTQIGVLQEHHVLLVLADKTLLAYALDDLDPSINRRQPEKRPFYKLGHHISYFNTGKCSNRPLVVAMKRKGMDSHFKAFEPVCGDLRHEKNAKYLSTKSSFLSKSPSWFKLYKEFYIGADSSAVHFLKSRIMVVCARGFEIIDLENLSMNRNLPDLTNPDFAFMYQQQRRIEHLKPIGMFRCNENFLLCYDLFAFLVDNRGNYVRKAYPWIEWEGTPQAVGFSYPFVIAFDANFIEVRHVETGALVQVIIGDNVRCLQYRQDPASASVIHGSMLHTLIRDSQYVFQLVPA
ncbi:RHO1 GDP-GTP exchange protein 2 [Apophysomyces ossiformis]|uniref:RHO1 GDP-GTP exchange protein 2 n=1 Tax=Apophysomyces ossiformis TaxID=679940 RepID=A0A8H7BFU8_9FUNG|nr:RHO1 GDP-GTP exchange protein 2 [Apophysomyces ossiformis]